MTARPGDWKTTPLPDPQERIDLDLAFSLDEFAFMQQGVVPKSMDDFWFVFFEEPWMYCHRSWSGICIFKVRFASDAIGVRVSEAYVNRDQSQYRSQDVVTDVLMATALLDGLAGRENRSTWDKYFERLRSSGDPA